MVSSKDWWAGLIAYNTKIFPIQLIVMLVAILLTLLLRFRPSKTSSNLMKAFLNFSMLFNGVVFFIILGDKLPSPLNFVQGGLFIVIGILFSVDIVTGWSFLSFPPKGIQRNITYALLIVVALYPVFGLLRGHNFAQLIYPGTLPCGSTAFALVILSASLPKVNKAIYVLLLIWAIPFAPLIQIPQFKVYEDIIMFATGMYALVILVRLRKFQTKIKEDRKGII